jgi:hypothetical protein
VAIRVSDLVRVEDQEELENAYLVVFIDGPNEKPRQVKVYLKDIFKAFM